MKTIQLTPEQITMLKHLVSDKKDDLEYEWYRCGDERALQKIPVAKQLIDKLM